jgi:hypothetical protein
MVWSAMSKAELRSGRASAHTSLSSIARLMSSLTDKAAISGESKGRKAHGLGRIIHDAVACNMNRVYQPQHAQQLWRFKVSLY